jgi:hypothetical protein
VQDIGAHNTVRRANDPQQRKKYVDLVEAVQRKGGEVLMFSSMHESGQRMLVSATMSEYCSPPDPLLDALRQN